MAREQRKLAAIIAADVVGYSRLMGRDESWTLAALQPENEDSFKREDQGGIALPRLDGYSRNRELVSVSAP